MAEVNEAVNNINTNVNENEALNTERILSSLAEDNRRQTLALEKQLLWTRIEAGVLIIAVITLLSVLLPFIAKANNTMEQIDVTIVKAQEIMNDVNEEIENAELSKLFNNANQLISQSEESLVSALDEVEGAVSQFKEIDLKGLNSAIEDLQAVVDPLANLFGRR